jgi:hypothetical protein
MPRRMNEDELKKWLGGYLDAFAACGRGERESASLLSHYGVPIVFTTDVGCFVAASEAQVVAIAQQQIDGMRAAKYHHSEVLESAVTLVNATSALVRGAFSRVRADGSEIGRVVCTYLVTDGAQGRRISALLVHH